MSRASRRARGRQSESSRSEQSGVPSVSNATRQIGALQVGLSDGSVRIDATKLEAPTQAYDADAAWVQYRPGNLSLFFAKKNRVDPKVLESLLEVRYPPEDFVNTFWKISKGFFDKLSTYVASWPDAAREIDTPPEKVPAKRSHSEWVTFTYMSHSGTEAAIDFYHLAPPAIARFALSKSLEGLRLRPVVRVQLTSFELFGLIERLGPVIEDIVRVLPENHRASYEKVDESESPD
jgi:hypothetical protein